MLLSSAIRQGRWKSSLSCSCSAADQPHEVLQTPAKSKAFPHLYIPSGSLCHLLLLFLIYFEALASAQQWKSLSALLRIDVPEFAATVGPRPCRLPRTIGRSQNMVHQFPPVLCRLQKLAFALWRSEVAAECHKCSCMIHELQISTTLSRADYCLPYVLQYAQRLLLA